MIDHDKKSPSIKRISIINIVTNILLAIAKITSGMIFFSPALISDGVHSFSDLITDIAVIISYSLSTKPSDESHPYGHGKIEGIANMFIAFVLLWAGVLIIYTSIDSLLANTFIEPNILNISVAAASILAKEILFHLNMKAGKKANNETLITNAWHHRSDAVSSVAVVIGIALGLINPALAIADPIVSIIISIFILVIGGKILFETLNKMIDRNIDLELLDQIKKDVINECNVISLHNLRGRYYGGAVIVDMHIQLKPDITLKEAHKITHDVKSIILQNFPQIIDVVIHTEPAKENEISAE